MTKNPWVTALAVALLCLSSLAAAQQPKKPEAKEPPPPPNMATVLNRQFSNVESEFVSAAEAMPEEKLSFAPTHGEFKGVRTFAQQVKHVAAANYLLCAAILEEKPPADAGTGENGPDSVKTKAEILNYLKDSFACGHKALSTIDEKNATVWIKSPFGPGRATRLGLAVLSVAHPFDHYGQMVEYLRMNGIIPPASRPEQK